MAKDTHSEIPPETDKYVFPAWSNYLLVALLLAGVGAMTYLPVLAGFGLSAEALNVGYAPEQPVPFSHAQHVGKLGLDCRYCHTTVDEASFAAIPPTQTCMNCHSQDQIHGQNPLLNPVRESHKTGLPVEWVKVHDLPDYAYFDHSAHINKGIGCTSCHDRVDRMEVVYQARDLSMAWCLDCHRQPEKHLRPRELVTKMDYTAADLFKDEALRERFAFKPPSEEVLDDPKALQLHVGGLLKDVYEIQDPAYMMSCSLCHR